MPNPIRKRPFQPFLLGPEPIKSTDDAAWRTTWIKRALKTVKRGQAEIRYQAALMDAYAEHLSVLEMTLIAAAEQKPRTENQQI
jgi:hypothetical protein